VDPQYKASEEAARVGLSTEVLQAAVEYVYETADAIDTALLARGSDRLADIVELANLSSMLGNLLRSGIANNSAGKLRSNGPHKHPDLLHCDGPDCSVEIKVALEDNQPKGHLAKPGLHLTCHYVLCGAEGRFCPGVANRGSVPRIWLLRFGRLEEAHFNISNTQGDSGKTAVVNAEGMRRLVPIYFAPDLCPLVMSARSKKSRELFEHFGLGYVPR
jgi:hypothetical protein